MSLVSVHDLGPAPRRLSVREPSRSRSEHRGMGATADGKKELATLFPNEAA